MEIYVREFFRLLKKIVITKYPKANNFKEIDLKLDKNIKIIFQN